MDLWAREKGGYSTKKVRDAIAGLTHEDIKSIAIIRHGAIGDQVVLRPLIMEFKELFDNAKITLSLIESYQYGAPVDIVDRVHVVYKKIEGKKTSSWYRFKQIKELGEHDIIVDLSDSALSMWLVLLNKAKIKMGFPHRSYRKLLYNIVLQRSDFVLETENMLHFAYVFGARGRRPFNYAFPVYETEKSNPYICYFMSASIPFKCWPKDHFIALIDRMAKAYPEHTHVLMEGIGEDEKVDDMLVVLNGHKNVIKQAALGLDEVYSYLGKATMVVSNDTGVRNMAIVVNTPTVGIFFITSPFRYWPRDTYHEVVFGRNHFEIPSIEMVFKYCIDHMTRISNRHSEDYYL